MKVRIIDAPHELAGSLWGAKHHRNGSLPKEGSMDGQFTCDFFGGAGGSGAIWMPSSFSALISAGLASP